MIQHAKNISLLNQQLWLLPQKALYWQEQNALMIADLHIGKSGHFRKHGIPVPGDVNATNLQLLTELVEQTAPKQLIILGDLFHSQVNREWEEFEQWRQTHADLEVHLVTGNHDILSPEHYERSDINSHDTLSAGPFLMVHDPQHFSSTRNDSNLYGLSGHVHPAVRLTGKGRQSIKLPCFYFGADYGIVPAFGEFTGTFLIKPKRGEKVFAVAEDQVVAV